MASSRRKGTSDRAKGSRTKGVSNRPKAEGQVRSASRRLGSIDPAPQGETASTASTTPRRRQSSLSRAKKPKVPPDPASEAWLLEELGRYAFSNLRVSQGAKLWTIYSGDEKLGQLARSAVLDRDVSVLQREIRLPVVVRVEMVRHSLDEYDSLEAMREAKAALYEELFDAGRRTARYLSDLIIDYRIESRARDTEFSNDETSLETWAYGRIDAYEEERVNKKKDAFTGAVKSVISRTVHRSFLKWRKANYSEALSQFTSKTILLRNDSWKLERTSKGWIVHFAINSRSVPTKNGKEKREAVWHSVVVSTNNNPHVHATLRKMQSGEIDRTDAKLVWEKGNRCWAFRLGGMRPRPQRLEGTGMMAIRRGLGTPLYRLLSSGRWFALGGGPYLAQKKGIEARRSRIAASRWERGSGSRGHGRKKRHKEREHLSERESLATRAFIRNAWAGTIKIAKRHGISVIVMEDFGSPVDRSLIELLPDDLGKMMKRFPWGELKSWGKWKCEQNGIKVIEVSAANRSHICPCCGDESSENHAPQKRELRCVSCKARMPSEFADAWNMLRAAGLANDEALQSVQRGYQKMLEELAAKKESA